MENSITPYISIAIPVWGIKGLGVGYLEYSFNILAQQTFKDFEVIISDHSEDNEIEEFVKVWSSLLDITYERYEIGRGMISPNLNNAIKKCKGQYIKILFQDDFLYDEHSLNHIANELKNNNINWLVTSCAHTKDMSTIYDIMIPKYNSRIYEGVNTISCPSVLTIKNDNNILLFDESLNWLMDVEYYKRCYDRFGLPTVVNELCIINRESDIRASTIIDDTIKKNEIDRIKTKYDSILHLDNVTLIAVTSVRVDEHIKALKHSSKDIRFGAIKIITNEKPNNLPLNITYEYIDKMSNIDEWSHSIIYKLDQYVNTDFAILIHDDGFIINAEQWKPEFLNYDYIGAPWPIPNDNFSYRDINGKLIRAGNSVSLRSKKLIDLPNRLNLEWKPFHGFYNEDGFICVNNRHIYEEHGCKFGDIDIAKYFSHESKIPEIDGITPFAFHCKNHPVYSKIVNS
jgi:hypothetical protein